MPRNQIVVHLRNNQDFSLDDLVEIEEFLCSQDGLDGVEFDGHDYGPDDSNIFLFSDDLGGTIEIIEKSIERRFQSLNFAIGAKLECVETDYNLIAFRGINEIILH